MEMPTTRDNGPSRDWHGALTLLQKQAAIQIIDNHHVMILQALAGLMAGNSIPDRGKPANGIVSGENPLELERGNPPAFATARNSLSDRTHGFLRILLVPFLLASTTTAHAFSAAPGSPNFSNFPRKRTWVAPKALPELMNDMYKVHGATETAGDIGVFDLIGEGTRASTPAVDLKLMGLDSTIELRDGLPTTLALTAAYDAEGQEFPIDTTTQEIHDGGAAQHRVASISGQRPVYVEEDGAVKSFNFGLLRSQNDSNEIANIETDDASVVRCEETADMAVQEGKHGSIMRNKMVVGAAPTQSWGAEHLEKSFLTDEVDLKLMGLQSIVEIPSGLPATLAEYDAEGQEFPIDTTTQEIHDGGAAQHRVASISGQRPEYVEEDGAVKSFDFGPDLEGVEVLITTRLCNMKTYIEILRSQNDNNEIANIETDDASVVRCEETADMAVQEGKHGSIMRNKMVVGAVPTQSWGAEHLEKSFLTDEVDLKLMGLQSIVELPSLLATLAEYNAEGQEFPIDTTTQEIHDRGAAQHGVASISGQRPVYVEEDGAVKSFDFGPGLKGVEVLITTRLCNMKTYIEILRGPNDNNGIGNIETTDDASV
ncbi:hypothetical protein THAOC_34805, partial [Thalassiosira oceanica]